MKHPDFTAAQLRDLKRLGVTREQVEALRRVLPSIQWTTQSVPVTDIYKRLLAIASDAEKLAKELKQLKRPHDRATGQASFLLWEAHGQRLHDDHYAAPLEPMPLNPPPDKLAMEIERLAAVADAAIARMKDKRGKLKQSRPMPASPRPIANIDEALLDGWGKTYTDHLTDEQLRRGEYPRPLPAYPFAPSIADGSPFRKIVSLCYQAAHHPTVYPERAIKTYLRYEHQRWGDVFEWTEVSPTQSIGRKRQGDGRSEK